MEKRLWPFRWLCYACTHFMTCSVSLFDFFFLFVFVVEMLTWVLFVLVGNVGGFGWRVL